MKSALTLLLALAAAAHAQFAVMHTNGVVTSPTNLTIQQSNVSGLSNALAGKLGTNPTLAISNTTGLQTALDGKLATNGTLQVSNVSGLQSALDTKLGFNATNGQVQWTNTNALTFTNRPVLKGPDTTNIPALRFDTSDGLGFGSFFTFSRAHATNLWPAEEAQTNWSQMIWGLNVQPKTDGSDRSIVNTNIGATFWVMENEWKAPVAATSPVSEVYVNTTDRSGKNVRGWGVFASQTNSDFGHVIQNYPLSIYTTNLGFFNATAGLTVQVDNISAGIPHVEIRNMVTNNTSTRLYLNQNNNIGVLLVNNSELQLWRNVEPHRALRSDTNGVLIAGGSGTAIASKVHLGGNTRIDGAISFNNATNEATTRTNLGLGGGITTNVSSGTLQFSNGILVGHTP